MNKVFLVNVNIELVPRLKKSNTRSARPIERKTVITVEENNLNLESLNKPYYIAQAARCANIRHTSTVKITNFSVLREAKGV